MRGKGAGGNESADRSRRGARAQSKCAVGFLLTTKKTQPTLHSPQLSVTGPPWMPSVSTHTGHWGPSALMVRFFFLCVCFSHKQKRVSKEKPDTRA
jgi:hypothetical protein